MSARLNLLKQYTDNFATLTDADITKMVNESAEIQKQTMDLRMKYFGILSQKIGAKAAGRFAHIDDYLTTLVRLGDARQHAGASPAQAERLRGFQLPRPRGEALPDQGQRLVAFLPFERQARRPHALRARPGLLLHELDELHELRHRRRAAAAAGTTRRARAPPAIRRRGEVEEPHGLPGSALTSPATQPTAPAAMPSTIRSSTPTKIARRSPSARADRRRCAARRRSTP